MRNWKTYAVALVISTVTAFTCLKSHRKDIPPDLRDAVADSVFSTDFSALQDTTVNDIPKASEASVLAKGPAASTDDAIRLARKLLDNSLQRTGEYPNEKFWQSVRELRAAFDNPFIIKNDKCKQSDTVMYTLKSEYYLDQSSSRKRNVIHICKGYNPEVELKAQDFIHETSHVALTTFEHEATEIEMMVTHLGGGYPVLSGYISYNENLTPEDFAWLGYGFLAPSLGITSKVSFHYQQLRADIVYNDFSVFVKRLAKFPAEQDQLLDFVDMKGFTLTGIACSLNRTQFLDYLKVNYPLKFKDCK